ncbi:hypothetical protein D9M69_622570 [compost metagenome]
MRAHHDQVGRDGDGGVHDAFVHHVAVDHALVAVQAFGRQGGHAACERRVGAGGGRREVFVLAERIVRAHADEGVVVDHVDQRDAAAEGQGETAGLADREHGSFGAVDGDQDVIEHGGTSLSVRRQTD